MDNSEIRQHLYQKHITNTDTIKYTAQKTKMIYNSAINVTV